MSLIKKILAFFGFGGQMEKTNNFEQLLDDFSSIARQDEAKKSAFQAIQKGDDLNPERPHPYESTIRADALTIDTACTQHHTEQLKKSFGDAQYISVLLQVGLQSELTQASPPEIEAKISSAIAQNEAESSAVFSGYKQAEHDLAVFKGANGLSSAAIFPDKNNALYLIVALGIIEALFNAFFLRQGINFTVSLLISISVAIINIGGNVWLGGRYRDKNHVNQEIAKSGRLNRIFSFALILGINGIVAVYRLWYASSSQEMTGEFLLESTMLFIVGIAMGIVAFNKGYALDDPYPGYGTYTRRLNDWADKLVALRKMHAEYCSNLKMRADSVLDTLESKIINASETFALQLPEMSRQLKIWNADRSKVNFAYRQLQEIFKLTINGYHPKAKNGYPMDVMDLPSNVQLNSFKEQVTHFLESKDDLKERVNRLREEVRLQKEQLQTWWQSEKVKDLLSFPK